MDNNKTRFIYLHLSFISGERELREEIKRKYGRMSKEKEIRDKNEKKEKDNEWVSDWASESNQIKRKQWKKKWILEIQGRTPNFSQGRGNICSSPSVRHCKHK